MSTGGEGGKVPDEGELRRVARPATVRRAPKFGAFIGAGALIGAVLGLVLALLTRSSGVDVGTGFIPFLDGAGTVGLETVLALGVLGCLVGGAFAIGADRRSIRRR
jgi:hypothetical protein